VEKPRQAVSALVELNENITAMTTGSKVHTM
jgi:hypothetical protein